MMVRMTAKLKRDILRRLQESFNSRIVALERKKVPETELADAWYALAVEPYRDVMERLPDGFFEVDDTIRFSIDEAQGMEATKIAASLSDNKNLPYKTARSYNYPSYGVTWDHMPTDLRDRYEIHATEKKELEEQRNQLEGTVKDLLEKCNTLKDFITAWPTGMDFVPDAVKRQHEAPEVRGRKKGAKEAIEVAPELDALVSLNKLLS